MSSLASLAAYVTRKPMEARVSEGRLKALAGTKPPHEGNCHRARCVEMFSEWLRRRAIASGDHEVKHDC
jgi:hypothetical protein